MSTYMPGFHSLSGFLHHSALTTSATSSTRVNPSMPGDLLDDLKFCFGGVPSENHHLTPKTLATFSHAPVGIQTH